MNRPRLLTVVLCVFCLFGAINLIDAVGMNQGTGLTRTNITSQLTDHGPIDVSNNAGLALLASSGSGTYGDPYLISNLRIELNDTEFAVIIEDTDAHFKLLDCEILLNRSFGAILFSNVTNGVIESCQIWCAGIFMDFSNHSAVVDCLIMDSMSEAGINLNFCYDIRISGNSISGSPTGIFLLGSEDCWVSSNHIFDNDNFGVDIYLSKNTTLHENTLENNGVFLSLWDAGYNGHSLEGSQYIDVPYNFVNNTVNGKPLGFFHETLNGVIDGNDYGQLILLNCTDVEVVDGNFRNVSVGMQVHYSQNCTINEVTISRNSHWGMYIYNSNFISIENSDVSHNAGVGIHCEWSNNTRINQTAVRDNEHAGLYVQYSNECTISSNSISQNAEGIHLDSSNDCSLIDNEVIYNTIVGISLSGGSSQNTVYGNSIGWNGRNAENQGINFWDNGVNRGNSWSDYSGVGYYQISHGGVDHYPRFLGNPLLAPTSIIGMIVAGIIVIVVVFWFRHRRAG